MSDFTIVRSYTYIAGNLIDPVQNNYNENTVYNAFNSTHSASSGHGHSGGTGDGGPVYLKNLSPTCERISTSFVLDASVTFKGEMVYEARVGGITLTIDSAYAGFGPITLSDATGAAGASPLILAATGGTTIMGETALYMVEPYGSITVVRSHAPSASYYEWLVI